MRSYDQPIRYPVPSAQRARVRAMSTMSVEQAQRQLWLSVWLVAGLLSATLIAATVNLLA